MLVPLVAVALLAALGTSLGRVTTRAVAAPPTTTTTSTTTTSTSIGVTRTTITVAGIVGSDPSSTGADVGAQARFARANRSGGVAHRTVRYAGNVADPAAAASSAFAVVPAVSAALDPSALSSALVPFVGSATTTGWNANAYGFGFVGLQAPLQTRVVDPSWGTLLRSLLGDVRGAKVALAADADELGTARAEQARLALRAAGFTVARPVALAAPPASTPDFAAVAAGLATGQPTVVLLLTSAPTTSGVAQELARAGFTGTVATDASSYQPTAPGAAAGLTVLVPYAPLEQRTAANRRMAADVDAFAPGAALTAGIAAGYWSADLFLRMLAKTGARPTRVRFLRVARRFSGRVPGAIGTVTWPAMHARGVACGALVQDDGSEYLVAVPYACGRPLTLRAHRGASETK